jgi:hypothetical protein
MASKKGGSKHTNAFGNVKKADIMTAAKSLADGTSYEGGYPAKPGTLHMNERGGIRKKG